MKRSEPFRFWKLFDSGLFIATVLLCVVGLTAIYASGQVLAFQRQLLSCLIGLVFFVIFALIDYRSLRSFSEILYAGAVLLLIVVLNLGHEAYGAQRWLVFHGISLQPSEIAKIALIIAMAKFLELRQAKMNSFIETVPAFLLVGVPFFIIFKQPDLGSSIVLVILFLLMAFWAGMKLNRLFLLASPLLSIVILYVVPLYPLFSWLIYLAILFGLLYAWRVQFFDSVLFFGLNVISGIISPLLWAGLNAYQRSRIIAFINPAVDPLAQGVRYHTVKSLIAVGSGGLFGKGFMQGPLTNLQYIPQQHTDFIFSIIGEEFGFLGAVLVVGLFLYVCWRLVVIATQSNTVFGTLISVGMMALIFFQAFVNIGMNLGMVPVVGIPLPFVSYGGSALIAYFIGLGICQSVAMRKRDLIF